MADYIGYLIGGVLGFLMAMPLLFVYRKRSQAAGNVSVRGALLPQLQPNVSLLIFASHRVTRVVLLRDVTRELGFKPAMAVLGEGLDMASIMEPDVAAWLWSDYSVITFRRARDNWAELNSEFVSKGWLSLGCQAVSGYGSILEYRSSPG